VRLKDIRGFGGTEYHYQMQLRPRQPGFKVRVEGWQTKISPETGRELTLKVDRLDDFQGVIRIEASQLPEGFQMSTPILIQAGQHMATGTVYVDAELSSLADVRGGEVMLKAVAMVGSIQVEQDLGVVGKVEVGDSSKVVVEVLSADPAYSKKGPLELTIKPGQTISAKVRIQRNGFEGRVEFGNEDAGRNLPHGLFVDNIGLNGLMIIEGQTEREFFITAAKWVPETTRLFHLRTNADGGQCSQPVMLHVKAAKAGP